MNQVNSRDVEAIKNWIAKEPYLPNTFDENVIRKFLYSCDNSLERTKRCIEEFCSRRASMPEVYCQRDPLSPRMQAVFSTTAVTAYMAGTDEVLIHQLTAVPDSFDFYDCVKGFTIQKDNWMRSQVAKLPENHVIVLDLKFYSLKLISKCNIFFFQKFLTFLLESMPVRLKEVHVINCPSFCDYMYNLVKPALPDYICNLVYFHTDHTGLYKYINKKHLPKDYGGEAQIMAEQHALWIKDVLSKRQLFLDDNYWKADLSKKLKNNSAVDELMSGSFRSLAVD